MKPIDAERGYQRDWPALNAIFRQAQAANNPKAVKKARQALSALSVEYSDRHRVEEPIEAVDIDYRFEPSAHRTPLQALQEQVTDLQVRVRKLEEQI